MGIPNLSRGVCRRSGAELDSQSLITMSIVHMNFRSNAMNNIANFDHHSLFQ